MFDIFLFNGFLKKGHCRLSFSLMLKYNKNSRVGEKNCGSFTRFGCVLGFVLLIIVLCGLKVTGYHAMQSRGSGGLCIDSGSLYKVVCCCRISRDAIARERGLCDLLMCMAFALDLVHDFHNFN